MACLRVVRLLTATVALTVPTRGSSMRSVTRGGRPGTDVLGTLNRETTGCCKEVLLASPYSLPPDSGAEGDCAPPGEPAWADAASSSGAIPATSGGARMRGKPHALNLDRVAHSKSAPRQERHIWLFLLLQVLCHRLVGARQTLGNLDLRAPA